MKSFLRKNYYTRSRIRNLKKILNDSIIECLKAGFICSFNFTIFDSAKNELVNKYNLAVCDNANCLCDVTIPPSLQNKIRVNLRYEQNFWFYRPV